MVSSGFFYICNMNLQVTITFVAYEEDWDISQIVGKRSIKDKQTIQDIVDALKSDADYVLQNADFEIKIDSHSI